MMEMSRCQHSGGGYDNHLSDRTLTHELQLEKRRSRVAQEKREEQRGVHGDDQGVVYSHELLISNSLKDFG